MKSIINHVFHFTIGVNHSNSVWDSISIWLKQFDVLKNKHSKANSVYVEPDRRKSFQHLFYVSLVKVTSQMATFSRKKTKSWPVQKILNLFASCIVKSLRILKKLTELAYFHCHLTLKLPLVQELLGPWFAQHLCAFPKVTFGQHQNFHAFDWSIISFKVQKKILSKSNFTSTVCRAWQNLISVSSSLCDTSLTKR